MAKEKTNIEIKGYYYLDTCNSKSKELREKFNLLEEENKRLYRETIKIEKEREVIQNKLKELRKQEVNNVLDYVRHCKDTITPGDIDTYLCHCQNMLNGNIDGTCLTFRDPKIDNKNEN